MTTAPKRPRGRPTTPAEQHLTERLPLRVTPQTAAAVRRAAGPGHGAQAAWLVAAVEAALGRQDAELAAWRAGREAGIREAQAALRALPAVPIVGVIEGHVHDLSELLSDAVHPRPRPSDAERNALQAAAALTGAVVPKGDARW